MRTNEERLFRGRRPTSTKFTITLRPPRTLSAIDLLLKHLNNGRVNRKRGTDRGRGGGAKKKRLNLEAAELIDSEFGELGEERRTSVESIRKLLEMKLSGGRESLLGDQNLTTGKRLLMRGAIARLPLGFEEEISEFVEKAEENVEEVEKREEEEAEGFVGETGERDEDPFG